MVKDEGNERENTQSNDLEAFEEWESGGAGAPGSEQGADLQPSEAALPEEPAVPEVSLPQESPPPTAAEAFADSLLELAPDVPVNLVAVIGKTTTNVGELVKLKLGQVIELGRPPGETVDVVANGRLIARAELVDVDGQLGVRILKMVR